jgi:putative NADH-flavin reductase
MAKAKKVEVAQAQAKDPFKFTVKEVTTIAWNNQKVELENDDAHVIIHLKNPVDFHSYLKGQDVVISAVDYDDAMATEEEEEEVETEVEAPSGNV